MNEPNLPLLEVEGIVFVSPIYYYDVNAQILAVIARFYAMMLQCLKIKRRR